MGRKHSNKTRQFMWYKVQELHKKGFNKSQISYELGLDRSTVRRYLDYDEESYYQWIESSRHLPKKLQTYYEYVKQLLESYPYLSAPQVEDRLRERYSSLPVVHSKTVYNFVNSIRQQYGIKKKKEVSYRQYENLPETDYGYQGQVDWGEYNMLTGECERRRKVYFFVMVLSRSRYKYVYFKDQPFDSRTTVEAHNLAFLYFGGQPRHLLYDQDRKLLVDENLGDMLLTREFGLYCREMSFEAVFCRKSDPESKGKVENVVGYVKKNFLSGRIYEGIDSLNASCLKWLERTGNGKVHASTQKIPSQEWLIEKEYLLPLPASLLQAVETNYTSYKVRKDNTISYHGNYYTLPSGTYQGEDTEVGLRNESGRIRLYDTGHKLLAEHPESLLKGQVIRNTDHRRQKSQSLEALKEAVLHGYHKDEKLASFIIALAKDKPRYLRDNLQLIKSIEESVSEDLLSQGLDFCLENQLYNANRLKESICYYQVEREKERSYRPPGLDVQTGITEKVLTGLEPEKSTFIIYQKICDNE
jgi:transposase